MPVLSYIRKWHISFSFQTRAKDELHSSKHISAVKNNLLPKKKKKKTTQTLLFTQKYSRVSLQPLSVFPTLPASDDGSRSMCTLKCPYVTKSTSPLISPWLCWKSMALKWPRGVFWKPETRSEAGKSSPGRRRRQTIAIIMSNVSFLTLAFIWKYKEQWEPKQEMNATERRTVGESVSLPLCLSNFRDGRKRRAF